MNEYNTFDQAEFEHGMCTYINMRAHNMSFEDAQKQATKDMKNAREEIQQKQTGNYQRLITID